MQFNFPLSSFDPSQILILESVEFLLFLSRYYCKIYPNFIIILKEFSQHENISKFCLSFVSLFAKYPVISKAFSLFLPFSITECFSRTNEDVFRSRCYLDTFLNPLNLDLQQTYSMVNVKGHTALHDDLQICLTILYSCLSKESVNSTNHLRSDLSINLACLFDKISFLSLFLKYDLATFLFRSHFYSDTHLKFNEIHTTFNRNSLLPPLFGDFDFDDAPLRAFFSLDYIHSTFGSQSVFDNFLKTITRYVQNYEYFPLKAFLFDSPYLFILLKDLDAISSNFTQLRLNLSNISFLSSSFKTASPTISKFSGVSYRSYHSPFPLSQSSKYVNYFSDQTFLNENFIQFPNTPDDNSFYCSRLLPAEEAILKCEEERFELDIVIETAKYTITCLERILCYISRNGVDQSFFIGFHKNLKTTSLSIPRSTIFRIYGERCDAIFLAMLQYPTIVVPIILFRLNERIQEWKDAQIHFNKIWRDTIQRSYIRGVDLTTLPFIFTNIKPLKGRTFLREVEFFQENSCFQSSHFFHNSFPLKLEIDVTCVLDVNDLIHHMLIQYCASQNAEIYKSHKFICFLENFFSDICSQTSKIKQIHGRFIMNYFSHVMEEPNLHSNSFFCNTCWYIFLRSYQIVISLLSHLKTCCIKLSDSFRIQPLARNFLEEFKNKSVFLTINLIYTNSLNLLFDLIHNKICSTAFEESSKDILGLYFYTLITLEKVLPILSKHVISLMNDKSFYTIIDQNNHFNIAELDRNGIFDPCSADLFQSELFYQILFNQTISCLVVNRIYFNQPINKPFHIQSINDAKTRIYARNLMRSNTNPLILIRNLKQFMYKKTDSSKSIISDRYQRFLDITSSNSIVFENDCFCYLGYYPHDFVCKRSKTLKKSRMHQFLYMLSYFF